MAQGGGCSPSNPLAVGEHQLEFSPTLPLAHCHVRKRLLCGWLCSAPRMQTQATEPGPALHERCREGWGSLGQGDGERVQTGGRNPHSALPQRGSHLPRATRRRKPGLRKQGQPLRLKKDPRAWSARRPAQSWSWAARSAAQPLRSPCFRETARSCPPLAAAGTASPGEGRASTPRYPAPSSRLSGPTPSFYTAGN